ncbi:MULTISPECIES: hypothetical protein [unclassified Rhizobium]|uniref:hypothetical protein n=1 Tax=unclassified Rhizobium TaxID=2613769 RepID=UPI003819B951
MKLARAIHHLFLVVAMLAVVIGPASIGLAASAMASPNPAMTAEMAGPMSGMQMAEHMPCCPEQKPVKSDCFKGCILALICTTSFSAQSPDISDWSGAISWQSHRYDLLPASQLTSAPVDPPARPPKA